MRITALSEKIVVSELSGDGVSLDVDQSKLHHQMLQGAGKNTHAAIDSHLSSSLNPHCVRAEQTGAVPVTTKDKPNGVPGLDSEGRIKETVIPISIARYGDVQRHANSNANPHNVTAVQIGAVSVVSVGAPDGIAPLDGKGRLPERFLPATAVTQDDLKKHIERTNNPHGVTPGQIGAIPSYEKGRVNGVVPIGEDGKVDIGFLPDIFTKSPDFVHHTSSSANPHKVTAVQVGAVPIYLVGKPDGVAGLDKNGHIPKSLLGSDILYMEDLDKHSSNTSNPHKVTTDIIGAVSKHDLGRPGGVAQLDASGRLPENLFPDTIVTTSSLDGHASRKDNPHKVTPSLIGAVAITAVGSPGGVAGLGPDGKISEKVVPETLVRSNVFESHKYELNPHGVTADQVGAISVVSKGRPGGVASLDARGMLDKNQVPYDVVLDSQLESHVGNNANPHNVTPEQVGSDSPFWNACKIMGMEITKSTPSDNQILRWSSGINKFVFDYESMVGEVNTGKSIGAGVEVYSGKSGDILLFRTIRPKSNLLKISTSEDFNSIEFDVNEANVDHSRIKNSGEFSHVVIDSHLRDKSNPHGVTSTHVGKDIAQWNADRILGRKVSTSTPSDGQVLKWNAEINQWVPTNEAALQAEPNAAANVGLSGIGIFKRKENAVLEFKKLRSLTNKLELRDDERNSCINLDINESTIVHDRLSGSGKYKHSELDSHIDSRNNPHNVTPKQVGSDNPEWNANRVQGIYVDTGDLRDNDILVYSKEHNKFVCTNIVDLVRSIVQDLTI